MKKSKHKVEQNSYIPSQEVKTNLDKLYYKIGEVSEITGVKPYILRYWESEFKFVNPTKTRSKQRLYKKDDVKIILDIKKLLYDEQFTISGAKKRLKNIIDQKKHQHQLNLSFNQNETSIDKSKAELLSYIKSELLEIKNILSK